MPAAAGSRYSSSPDRDANLQFAAAGAALDTPEMEWFVLASWMNSDWAMGGGREGADNARGARHLICPGKHTRTLCCGLIAAALALALDKPPVQASARCDRLAWHSTALSRSRPDEEGGRGRGCAGRGEQGKGAASSFKEYLEFRKSLRQLSRLVLVSLVREPSLLL
jgi:hypothetical protein